MRSAAFLSTAWLHIQQMQKGKKVGDGDGGGGERQCLIIFVRRRLMTP